MSAKLRILVATAVAVTVLLPSAVLALTSWNAKVLDVDDGDTFDANVATVGVVNRIRMTGIQAMEMDDYGNAPEDQVGPCMGPEAARRLIALIEDEDVVLSAVDPASTGSGNRPLRYVKVDVGGTMKDVGHIMVREGLALWSSNGNEWVKNLSYYKAAKAARRDKVGLWDSTYGGGKCASGPQQSAKLDMWIQWDADGPDGTNVNGEWVRIRNRGRTGVNIAGWTFRDPSLTTAGVKSEYTFPAGASIPAHRSIQLKVGDGTNTPDKTYFWGQDKPKFENVDYSRSIGDGGYLFDTDGSLRASFMYPCMPRGDCTNSLRGKVKVVKAMFDPHDRDELQGEYIDIKNVSARKVRLERYQLEVFPFGYAFGRGDVLAPDQVLRLFVKDSTDGKAGGRLIRYWGHGGGKASLADGPILNNNGDWARLKSFEDVQVHCLTWGGKRCGSTG